MHCLIICLHSAMLSAQFGIMKHHQLEGREEHRGRLFDQKVKLDLDVMHT